MTADTIPRHADELLAAKADEKCCCFIGDSGQAGATVFYRDGGWLVVKHFAENAVETAKELALVTLDEEADPEPLMNAALATDFEGDPSWLIDVRKFDELGHYGRALKVLWRSDRAA
jgi:hypothetical protein